MMMPDHLDAMRRFEFAMAVVEEESLSLPGLLH